MFECGLGVVPFLLEVVGELCIECWEVVFGGHRDMVDSGMVYGRVGFFVRQSVARDAAVPGEPK